MSSPACSSACNPTQQERKRAKIMRCGKTFYMPRRDSAADRERDQQLLSQIPFGGSPDEVAAAVVQLKAQREKEMADRVSAEHHASGGPSAPSLSSAVAASATLSGSHRAKITRGGKAVSSPLSAELATESRAPKRASPTQRNRLLHALSFLRCRDRQGPGTLRFDST